LAFTELELCLLDELVKDKANQHPQRTLTAYVTKLARLGAISPAPMIRHLVIP